MFPKRFEPSTIHDLPEGVMAGVCKHLEARDLACMATTSSSMNQAATHHRTPSQAAHAAVHILHHAVRTAGSIPECRRLIERVRMRHGERNRFNPQADNTLRDLHYKSLQRSGEEVYGLTVSARLKIANFAQCELTIFRSDTLPFREEIWAFHNIDNGCVCAGSSFEVIMRFEVGKVRCGGGALWRWCVLAVHKGSVSFPTVASARLPSPPAVGVVTRTAILARRQLHPAGKHRLRCAAADGGYQGSATL